MKIKSTFTSSDFSALLSCIIDVSIKFSFVINSIYVLLHWLLFLEKIIFMSFTLCIKILWLWKWTVVAIVVQSPRHVRLFATPQTCSLPGLSVPYHLLKFAQIHVHCIDDAIQPSHPLTHSSPSVLSLSQNQELFQWVSCSHQKTKILKFQLQHQSFHKVFRVDFH